MNAIRTTTRLNRIVKNLRRKWQLYLLCIPTFAWFVIFAYIPMYGVQIAFKDFVVTRGIWGSAWIGFENFTRFFSSYNFWNLIRNTVGISVYQLLVGFPAPILLALLLNEVRNQPFKKSIQMITYAPHFISTVVVVGILNIFFTQSNGLVNILLNQVCGIAKIPFLSSNEWFKTMYVFSDLWQSVGWGSIIYIATLVGIDPQLYEAAMIDGASKLQRVRYISIPGILPTAIMLLILNVGKIMSVGFEKVFLMQNSLNMGASDVISTYVYRVGLQGADFSFGSAVGLFNSIVNCVLLIVVNNIARKYSESSLW